MEDRDLPAFFCMRVGQKVHSLTDTKYLNLTKLGLFFNIISSAVHTFLPSVLQCSDPSGIEVLLLTLKKVLYSGNDGIITLIPFSSKMFFQVWEQKIIRWCQIRRIWRVINQFKASIIHSGHCNQRLVSRSIVLMKQDTFCQLSRPL